MYTKDNNRYQGLPSGFKLFCFDSSKINLSHEMLLYIGLSNFIIVCPSYMTCELNVPDDRFMNEFKNGTESNNFDGYKQKIQSAYNSTEHAPYGPPLSNSGGILPLDQKTVYWAMYHAWEKVEPSVMVNSFQRIGFMLPIHLTNFEQLKLFMKKALVLDTKKVPASSIQHTETCTVRTTKAKANEIIKRSKSNMVHVCLAHGCSKKFKLKRDMLSHLSDCRKWKTENYSMKKFHHLTTEKFEGSEVDHADQKNTARHIRMHHGLSKSHEFKCPGCKNGCLKKWPTLTKRTIPRALKHIINCDKVEEQDLLDLNKNNHPIFML